MKQIRTLIQMTREDKDKLMQAYAGALSNDKFKKFVSLLKIEDDLLMKYTSRLEDACLEYNNCSNCPGLSACKNMEKGFVLTPEQRDKTLIFTYKACHYKLKEDKDKGYLNNVYLFDIPKQIKMASMKDIYKDDANRKVIITKLVTFLKDYKNKVTSKGCYLSGSFGCGKTYLIAALFNELAKENVRSAIIYYPEFLRNLKESFDTNYKEKYETIKKIPLLLLDDIGAENLTPWSRDEILGSILQYRMDEELPTFFTSNLTLQELESHLSFSTSGVDKVKARRIIERIKQLTDEVQLVSKNRRDN
ncbi:MAG: primosomal protein DnaI [Bacilli bacterium]